MMFSLIAPWVLTTVLNNPVNPSDVAIYNTKKTLQNESMCLLVAHQAWRDYYRHFNNRQFDGQKFTVYCDSVTEKYYYHTTLKCDRNDRCEVAHGGWKR